MSIRKVTLEQSIYLTVPSLLRESHVSASLTNLRDPSYLLALVVDLLQSHPRTMSLESLQCRWGWQTAPRSRFSALPSFLRNSSLPSAVGRMQYELCSKLTGTADLYPARSCRRVFRSYHSSHIYNQPPLSSPRVGARIENAMSKCAPVILVVQSGAG